MSRRDEIIGAALACFVEHGVEATTIEMICKRAGASVGSLYHHFGNKEGLAADVYVAGLRDFQKNLLVAVSSAPDIETAVRTLVSADIDWIMANQTWANYIFHYRRVLVMAQREESFLVESRQSNQFVWNKMLKLSGAELLKGQGLTLEVVYCLIIAPVHEYARRWLEGRYTQPLDEQREIFQAAAWAGLSRR